MAFVSPGNHPTMMTSPVAFAQIARVLQGECARLGLTVPAFRAPPHSTAPRSIRRAENAVIVAVRLDRDPHDVTADLIEGCIQANPIVLADRDAQEMIRAALWQASALALAA